MLGSLQVPLAQEDLRQQLPLRKPSSAQTRDVVLAMNANQPQLEGTLMLKLFAPKDFQLK
jgi:hypothetical protein